MRFRISITSLLLKHLADGNQFVAFLPVSKTADKETLRQKEIRNAHALKTRTGHNRFGFKAGQHTQAMRRGC